MLLRLCKKLYKGLNKLCQRLSYLLGRKELAEVELLKVSLKFRFQIGDVRSAIAHNVHV